MPPPTAPAPPHRRRRSAHRPQRSSSTKLIARTAAAQTAPPVSTATDCWSRASHAAKRVLCRSACNPPPSRPASSTAPLWARSDRRIVVANFRREPPAAAAAPPPRQEPVLHDPTMTSRWTRRAASAASRASRIPTRGVPTPCSMHRRSAAAAELRTCAARRRHHYCRLGVGLQGPSRTARRQLPRQANHCARQARRLILSARLTPGVAGAIARLPGTPVRASRAHSVDRSQAAHIRLRRRSNLLATHPSRRQHALDSFVLNAHLWRRHRVTPTTSPGRVNNARWQRWVWRRTQTRHVVAHHPSGTQPRSPVCWTASGKCKRTTSRP